MEYFAAETDSRTDLSSVVAQLNVADYRHCRVLVAEDDPTLLDLVVQMLEDLLGVSAGPAADGDAALAALDETPADIAIVDMMMPGVHGLELIREIRARHPRTAVVVMTGHSVRFPYIEVIQAGAQDFIAKPFPPAELIAKVVRICNERALRKQQRLADSKYHCLFDLSVDGMMLVRASDYTILDANPAMAELCDKPAEALSGECALAYFEENDRDRLEAWLPICQESGRGALADLRIQPPGKERLSVDVAVTFVRDGDEPLAFLSCKDVTAQREVAHKLAEVVQKDSLTGLSNKRAFQNRIEWAVAHSCQERTPLALLAIDLDNFKRCNDTHGHQIGDALLTAVGEVIRQSIRTANKDEGFRCGGDEFFVLLPNSCAEAGIRVAERIQAGFAQRERFGTTMSIGVAELRPGQAPEALIRAADEALYRAKGKGKDAIEAA